MSGSLCRVREPILLGVNGERGLVRLRRARGGYWYLALRSSGDERWVVWTHVLFAREVCVAGMWDVVSGDVVRGVPLWTGVRDLVRDARTVGAPDVAGWHVL